MNREHHKKLNPKVMFSMHTVYSTTFLASLLKVKKHTQRPRDISKGSLYVTLKKKMVQTRWRTSEPELDLTDFMNDVFFGTANKENKAYDLTGRQPRGSVVEDVKNMGFDDSTRSNSGRLMQEWLEEARRVVAASPARHFGSPRFAATQQPLSPVPPLQRHPLSRSARRNRGFGESLRSEIVSKSVIHNRNKSFTFIPPSPPHSLSSSSTPAHRLFSVSDHPLPDPSLPPRPSLPRKSRFQSHYSLPPHSRRSFTAVAPSPDAQPISSSHDVADPARRRSSSHSNPLPLSPSRNRVESAHRRTISSSTCLFEKTASRPVANVWSKHGEAAQTHDLNRFLQEQRILTQKILNGDFHRRAKIVLSGHSNSTSSMVAAICYAWLLCYRLREIGDGLEDVVVPVINVERRAMWNLRQAAWLFDHAGLHPSSLLFADEVDIESLRMNVQHSILVVGQDMLSTTGEAGSQCTILTDNYCEDAYDLLQNSVPKKLLLAGILLDTQNLKEYAIFSMTRDSEAVQLLLVGSPQNYRYALFDQCEECKNKMPLLSSNLCSSTMESIPMKFLQLSVETVGDQSSEGEDMEHVTRERKSTSTSDREVVISSPDKNSTDSESAKVNKDSLNSAKDTAPLQPVKEPSGERNKFFLFRWFGLGSK